MADVNEWLSLPEGVTGQQVRYRETFESYAFPGTRYRLGGAEPKAIVTETEGWVIYRVWSSKGKDLGERCISRQEFEAEFERRPSDG